MYLIHISYVYPKIKVNKADHFKQRTLKIKFEVIKRGSLQLTEPLCFKYFKFTHKGT